MRTYSSASRKGDSSASAQEWPQSKLNITCSVWLDNDNRFSSNLAHKDQVADPVQKCIDKAVSVFKFAMEIPDPSQAKSDSMTQSRSAVRTRTLDLICPVFCPALLLLDSRTVLFCSKCHLVFMNYGV
jgi:hypothetical protein